MGLQTIFVGLFMIILATRRPSLADGNSSSNMRNIFPCIAETALGGLGLSLGLSGTICMSVTFNAWSALCKHHQQAVDSHCWSFGRFGEESYHGLFRGSNQEELNRRGIVRNMDPDDWWNFNQGKGQGDFCRVTLGFVDIAGLTISEPVRTRLFSFIRKTGLTIKVQDVR